MAVPTLDELFTAFTRDQVVASALQVAGQVELPVTAWEAGSVGREIIEILCQLMASFSSGAGSTAAAAGLLDYATGEWLTLTASQVYETDRVEATAGTFTATLTNTSNVPYTFNLNDVRLLCEANGGKTYLNTNTSPVNLAAWSGSGAYPTCTLEFVAEEVGTASNADVGQINQLASPLPGVTATNSSPCAGTDEETDTALVLRCRESVARLSPNGPADAYNYFAKSTVRGDGTNCGVTRTKVSQPVTTPGSLIVYLASTAGPVASTDVALVQTNLLENCVPTGITCTAASAVVRNVSVSANVYLSPSSTATAAEIADQVQEALEAYFESLPIGGISLLAGAGGYVLLDMLIATIAAANTSQIVQVTISSLGQDVLLAANEVAVLVSTAADINVVQT